jgi:hypothetical protein
MAIDTTSLRTRRAILIGALGGIAASVAAAVGRATPVSAADGDTVLVGGTYSATHTTVFDTGHTSVLAFAGLNLADGTGVAGSSMTGIGIRGASKSTTRPATLGLGYGNGTGVQGHSGTGGNVPAPPVKTGVVGSANQDATAVGVQGKSRAGAGVKGTTTTGVAVKGSGGSGRGGVFSGGTAQLKLVPSTATTHPSIGALGDLFLDKNKRLWFCKGGTIWVKLA